MKVLKRDSIISLIEHSIDKAFIEFGPRSRMTKELSNVKQVVVGLPVFNLPDADNPRDTTATIIEKLEPIVIGSVIGKKRYYCSHCNQRTKKEAKYCWLCGRLFVKER